MARDEVHILSQAIADEKSKLAVRQLERLLQSALSRISTLETDQSALVTGVSSITGSTYISVSPTTGAAVVSLLDIPESKVSGLVSDLASKSPLVHTHPESDITGLVADLAARPTGSGTVNTLPKWTSASVLGDSNITDDGSLVTVAGDALFNDSLLEVNPGIVRITSRGSLDTVQVTQNVAGQNNNAAMFAGTNTGTYDTTAAALNAYAYYGDVNASRSAGANTLTCIGIRLRARGGQTNQAIRTEEGDILLNNVSGTTTIKGATTIQNTLSVTGSVSIGNAGTDAHTLLGTLNANATAGTNGQILQISSGLPKWLAPSSASIPTGTGTANRLVKWTGTSSQGDAIVSDTGSAVTVGTATTQSHSVNGALAITSTVASRALHVKGNSDSTGRVIATFNANSTGVGGMVQITDGTNWNWGLGGANTTNDFEIRDGTFVTSAGTPRLRISKSTGDVSILQDLNVTGLSTLTGGFTLGADSSAGSHKITNLTNGSSAQDAAAFGQIGTAVSAAVSGTSGRSARFTGTNTVGDGAFTDDGINASITGTFAVIGGLATFGGGFFLGANGDANSHKITNLTNGSAAQDAAAFGQIASGINAAVSGTSGVIPKFTGANSIGNSGALDDGSIFKVQDRHLYISRTAGSPPVLAFNQAGQTEWQLYQAGSTNQFRLWSSADGDVLVVSGNDAAFAGDVTAAGNAAVTGTLSTTGNVTLGSSGSNAHTVNGSVSITQDATVGDDLTVTGNTSLNTGLSVTGNTTISGWLTAAGTGGSAHSLSGLVNINPETTGSAELRLNGGSHFALIATAGGEYRLQNNSTAAVVYRVDGTTGNTWIGPSLSAPSEMLVVEGYCRAEDGFKVGAQPAFALVNVQKFTSSGTYTPTTGTKAVRVRMVGGGGGGGGTVSGGGISPAGGGCSGAYFEKWINPGAAITGGTVTIGGGGNGGTTAPTNGSAGGDTAVTIQGTTYTAKGGGGGAGQVNSTGALAAGAGIPQAGTSSGDVVIDGCPGQTGWSNGSTLGQGGAGGSSPFGGGGAGTNSVAVGSAANGRGAGGGGGLCTSVGKAGGAGSAGLVIIEEYA